MSNNPAERSFYQTLPDFVDGYIAVVFGVEGSPSRRWCPKWWEHPPAAVRLDALWQSWEASRLSGDPGWLSLWLVSIATPTMAWIQSSEGPFRQCDAVKGHRTVSFNDVLRLKTELPPPELWG